MSFWAPGFVVAVGLAAPWAAQGGTEMKLFDPATPEAVARLSIVNDDVMGGHSTSMVAIEEGVVVFHACAFEGFERKNSELENTQDR